MKNALKILIKILPLIVNFLSKIVKKKKEDQESYSAPVELDYEIPEEHHHTNLSLADHETKMIFLDYGHGGIDENGNYTTKGKLYKHKNGLFHDDKTFYEGVFNRAQAKLVAKSLIDKDISFRFVADPVEDTSLESRVNYANGIARKIGIENTLYISFHADAFDGTARGFSIYTSPGFTKSDVLADALFKEVSNKMGHLIRMRFDKSDGDYDKEARFYVLTQTLMPALLIEHLFFDNFEDAKLLMDSNVQKMFADCTVSVLEKWWKEEI